MSRRAFLASTVAGATFAGSIVPWVTASEGITFEFKPEENIVPAPEDPALWPEFRRRLHEWREAKRSALNYSDALYRRPDFSWVSHNFACCFLMLCDEAFFDPTRGRYRVKEFLKNQQAQFGGYDSVVLWHAYPRIGLDDRNQFDFYREMPGGLKGLRRVVDQFHDRGIKVFIDYNPWDTGTRREGKPDLDALCDMVAALGVDGIFLDTMDRGAKDFRAKLDAVRSGVALESEIALPLERVHDHHFSWAQWFGDGAVPGVLRNKWFEPRHLQHQVKRWDADHTGELHSAWMNGSGTMIWENVFGSWMGWCDRDKSLLRSMLPIQRRYASVFAGEGWEPLVPTLAQEVYANLWRSNKVRLWTLVNRSEREFTGDLLRIDLAAGERAFNLLTGTEIHRERPFSGNIRPRGIGCCIAGRTEALGADFPSFLKAQRRIDSMAVWATKAPEPQAKLVRSEPTRTKRETPSGMVLIPAASFRMRVEFRERECGYYDSVPPKKHQFASSHDYHPWLFERDVTLRPFAVDLIPVTNRQYAEFLKASGYKPRDEVNFLQHWTEGRPPKGKGEHPVVYVSLEDARAYAQWAGKRLPAEEEWQYAAQGPERLRYPWGNELREDRCNGGEATGTTPVTQFPEGRSPFGVYDMCGNVWELTESERSDGRTRFCILKGGSFYTAKGSGWYMDGGPRPNQFAAKMLLMWPSLDRCATVGFRCAVHA